MLRRLALAILFVVAIVAAPRRSAGWQIRVYAWSEIEDRAAASTHVVVGRFVRWEREQENGAGPPFSVAKMYGEAALARVHVDQVIAGSNDVLQRDIVVIGTYAESAGAGALIFLRRDGDRFSIVNNSLFKMNGSDVDMATAPRKPTMPLTELRTRLRSVLPVRVTWFALAEERLRVGGRLPVVFVAKNEGAGAAVVMPPSYCASVKAYPLEGDGLWHADREKWFQQPDEWFAERNDQPVIIGPGMAHRFSYDIPLASLKMDAPGHWDIVLGMTESFCRAPAGEMHALPNAMSDRVVRVSVGNDETAAAPPRIVAPPNAPPRGGSAPWTASPVSAAMRASTFFGALLVGLLVARRRARGRGDR